jgi:hypothetical protein
MLATMLHIYILFFISISTASIILGLGPTNQQEYVIFGLLSLAYLGMIITRAPKVGVISGRRRRKGKDTEE